MDGGLVADAASPMPSEDEGDGCMDLLRVGHRGAAGTAPENTLASMRRALSLGVDGVEFDLHRTRDGHAGVWKGEAFAGERVPTLLELVQAVPAPTRLFLEIKAGSFVYPGLEDQLVRAVWELGILDRVQVSSFDHEALFRLRQLLPTLETGMLYLCNPVDAVAMARACGASALHPQWMYLTRESVASAHEAWLTVNVWTPNSSRAIAHCLSLGVDGIITDYPELLPSR